MIKEGAKAPDFDLAGSDGKRHSLKEFSGKPLVVYFYPKDDTPGCTIEANDFTKRYLDIKKLGADVVGISKDDYDSHCRFRDKYGLKILLLSDPESKVIKEYDAFRDSGIFKGGTKRKTFVLDKNGIVIKDFGDVNAPGHADAVVEFLKGLK